VRGDLTAFLAGLQSCNRADLVARWVELVRQPPPPSLSVQLLRSGVAYELQAAQVGALNRRTSEELMRLKGSLAATLARRPRPGAQLMREWNGVAHIVDIIDSGYRYRGETYKSLTAIAFEITGARWSGPRFFGLKSRAGK
jgi:hypothetical protein